MCCCCVICTYVNDVNVVLRDKKLPVWYLKMTCSNISYIYIHIYVPWCRFARPAATYGYCVLHVMMGPSSKGNKTNLENPLDVLYTNMKPDGGFPACYIGGGEDSFQECPSALATLSQSPWISKASLCLGRNLKVPSYLRHLRHWSSETLDDGVLYIYIHLFPFNLQPPKTNGWTLKIAFGKFQPLVFRGVECIHQCSLDSLKIWNRGFWSCKGLAFTQGVVESMGLKEMPLDIFQVSSNGCCWK